MNSARNECLLKGYTFSCRLLLVYYNNALHTQRANPSWGGGAKSWIFQSDV